MYTFPFYQRGVENLYSRFIYNLEIMLIAKSHNAILVSTARKKDIYRFDSFGMDMWFHSLNNKGYPATILQ